MRVLFVTRKYPPSVGGMELFAYDLSTALASHKDIDLELINWGGSGRVKAVLIALPTLYIRGFWALLRRPADVIHMQDGLLAPIGYILSRLFRRPFVVVIHGLDMTYRRRLFRLLVPGAVRRADAVICISQAAARAAQEQGVSHDRIQVVPLAVNDTLHGAASRDDFIKRLDLPADSQLLLTVGRLVERKGVAWFITHVLPGLVEAYPRLVYVVVGEGSGRPAVEAAIERTGLAAHVRLLGRVTDELYAATYNGADMFVMPNITVAGDMEGFGLVLLEASLCALPIVAADTEGIRDAVADDYSARLVPSGDAAAFSRAIGQWLDDPAAARNFGQKSRRYTLEHYQWPAIVEHYAATYQHLAKH